MLTKEILKATSKGFEIKFRYENYFQSLSVIATKTYNDLLFKDERVFDAYEIEKCKVNYDEVLRDTIAVMVASIEHGFEQQNLNS